MSVILNSPNVVIGHMSGGTININNSANAEKEHPQPAPQQVEDITPVETSDIPDSIIFTKKAKKEAKEADILKALKNAFIGRKDKTRALVAELQSWQKEGYIDAHYNARVMYDEMNKIIPLPFGYEVFKKYYNHTL